MKKAFKITDKQLITEVFNEAEYGLLSLSGDKAYAVPVNFIYLDEAIYFHGSTKGKKMRRIQENANVAFNVITSTRIVPSYFSSKKNLACPATTFFKSIIIDGKAEVVTNRDQVAEVFTVMMQKLQPEGRYTSFDSSDYDKQFKALSVVRIHISHLSAKFKFGQTLNQERFEMIIQHLEASGDPIDLLTLASMKQFYDNQPSH